MCINKQVLELIGENPCESSWGKVWGAWNIIHVVKVPNKTAFHELRVNLEKLGFKYECAGICFMQYSFNHVIEGSVDGVNHGFSIDVLLVLE